MKVASSRIGNEVSGKELNENSQSCVSIQFLTEINFRWRPFPGVLDAQQRKWRNRSWNSLQNRE